MCEVEGGAEDGGWGGGGMGGCKPGVLGVGAGTKRGKGMQAQLSGTLHRASQPQLHHLTFSTLSLVKTTVARTAGRKGGGGGGGRGSVSRVQRPGLLIR